MQEIITPRLSLRLMTEDVLIAGLDDNQEKIESLLGFKISQDWLDEKDLMNIRLHDYQSDSAYLPWGLRAIGLKKTKEMIGFIGFHSCPNPDDLQQFAPHAIEFGYTIFFKYRRQGFAYETIIGLLDWAITQYPLENFIASVSPTNLASTALIKKLEFKQIGEQIDETDGLELVYALKVNKMLARSRQMNF